MENRTASRAAMLELQNERRVVEDGHRFLDEKRALLAHEVLERIEDFARRLGALRETESTAAAALADAVFAEGLEALQLYPEPETADVELTQRRRSFLGVTLVEKAAMQEDPAGAEGVPVPDPPLSKEAGACADAFDGIVAEALPLATELGNLLRLMREFQRTQRRVRALEKVVLPELREDEKRMEDALDELDQEDAIRVRLAGRQRESAAGRGPR